MAWHVQNATPPCPSLSVSHRLHLIDGFRYDAPYDPADRLPALMARVARRPLAPDATVEAVVDASAPPVPGVVPPDYIQAEAFLEVSGYFTPSSKRIRDIYVKAKTLRTLTDVHGQSQTLTVTISANHERGLPITSDLDYYRAFLKLCQEQVDRTRRFQLPLAVPTSTLLRYAGKRDSARARRDVRAWFERMTLTGIKGALYRAKQQGYEEGFVGTVFSQVILTGQRLRNGRLAATNYVWPSPWFLSNYYYRHTRPLDVACYQQLRKPIAKALYTLLEQGWYAADGQPYAKSYRALCAEFLLTRCQHRSRLQQQLDPAHRELQAVGFLARWAYRQATTRGDTTLVYYPGPKFFADQQAKAGRRRQTARGDPPPSPALPRDDSDRAQLLLGDILDVCGDRQNTAAYLRLLKTHPEPRLRMALAETRQAQREGRITKSRGAYFTDTLQRLAQAHTRHTTPHPPSRR